MTTPSMPPPVPVSLPRAKGNLAAAVASLQIPTNPRYAPEAFPGVGVRTKCNKVAEDFCDAMGVHLPKGLLAREQIAWLISPSSRLYGWMEAARAKADEYAEKGHPVLVTWLNPVKEQSSHIAVLRSAGRIAQAGRSNFVDGSIASGFGDREVRFWVTL